MVQCCSGGKKYLLAVTLGAVGGGLLMAWATRAMPGMMSSMMSRMGGEGCSPAEM
jgi:hypothetical protein